jgi:hypothetical protein
LGQCLEARHLAVGFRPLCAAAQRDVSPRRFLGLRQPSDWRGALRSPIGAPHPSSAAPAAPPISDAGGRAPARLDRDHAAARSEAPAEAAL